MAVAVALVAVIATAPAWSLRLMPLGTWEEVPAGWNEAAGAVDKHAAGTRTLIVPEASFERQEWGWPRDEPLQALASSNFATRDAIPLVHPEAIRGLDGLMAVTKVHEPGSEEFAQAARGFGIGAVLDRSAAPTKGADAVTVFDPHADMMITDGAPWDLISVSGGGEVLPMLDAQFGYAPRQLSAFRAGDGPPGVIRHDIVTDTPALAVRNYGTLEGPMSFYLPAEAQQASAGSGPVEGGEVGNRITDYPSDGIRVKVEETGGSVRASSSAADATAFGGADPSRSLTSAVDGLSDTAWYPAPGDPGWIEVTSSARTATVTATDDVTVRVTHIGVSIPDEDIELAKGEPVTIDKLGSGLRLYLGAAEDGPVGIEEIDAGVRRIVTVKQVGDNYFFQRLMPATDLIHRAFTVERDTTYTLSAPARIDGHAHEPGPVELEAGRHELISEAETVALTTTIEPKPWQPMAGRIEAVDHDRTILTTRSHNGGLRGKLIDGDAVTELKPVKVGAGQQGFIVPAGAAGDFTMTFAADTAYRASLFLGGALSLLTLAACVWMLPARRRGRESSRTWASPQPGWIAPAIAATAAAGWPGALVFVLGLLIRRFTLLKPWVLGVASISMMALWMARAPWPSQNYAGDSVLVALAGALALAALVGRGYRFAWRPSRSSHRMAGTSTRE